jgi:hypothetical protein
MRRHSDDDLRHVDSRWRGPKGMTLPVGIPMKGIPVGVAAAIPAVLLLRLFGVPVLPRWVLALAIAVGVAKAVLAVAGSDRPLRALAALVAGEVSAPRPVANQPRTMVFQACRAGRREKAAIAGRPR